MFADDSVIKTTKALVRFTVRDSVRDALKAVPHFRIGSSIQVGEAGFVTRKRERCEDCDLREALKADGSARWRDGRMLTRDMGPCEQCGGAGDLPAPLRLDRYAEAA